MPNIKLEKILIEAVGNLLSADNLGFVEDCVDPKGAHHVQFQFEEINDEFALKVKDSNFFENLTSTFRKIHSYKWISEPINTQKDPRNETYVTYPGGNHRASFIEAFISDLRSQGVPTEEISKGVEAIEELQKKYGDGINKSESDVGYPENLDDIRKSIQNPSNKPVSDFKKDTFSGDNEPFTGIEPKNVRPIPNEA